MMARVLVAALAAGIYAPVDGFVLHGIVPAPVAPGTFAGRSLSPLGERTLGPCRTLSRSASLGTAHWGQAVAGVVEMKDKATGVPVYVVGSMHYIPVSIKRARAVASTLAENGLLSSVVVESCPTRWERSRPEKQPEWVKTVRSPRYLSPHPPAAVLPSPDARQPRAAPATESCHKAREVTARRRPAT